jgi:hypothetical protein
VTEVPYPISASFFVSRQGWRDLEFWNKSVRYAVHYPAPDTYGDALIWFPNNSLGFDLATGAATRSLTPYVVQAVTETRFRISGTVVLQRPDVMLIRTEQPWRTDWLTSGLYDDGWMEPHKPALIRVFAKPDQTGPVVRTLTLRLAPSPGLPRQSFTLSSNRANLHGEATRARSALESIEVCVPPGRFAEVRLTTPQESIIPADANPFTVSPGPRRGGLFVNDLSLADEVGGPCAP